MITDLTPYREFLDAFDISEEQKLKLVNALWVLAESILDEQFGLTHTGAELEPKKPLKNDAFNALSQKKNL